jgi:hypothetical protein
VLRPPRRGRRRQPGMARRRRRPGHDTAAHRGALGGGSRRCGPLTCAPYAHNDASSAVRLPPTRPRPRSWRCWTGCWRSACTWRRATTWSARRCTAPLRWARRPSRCACSRRAPARARATPRASRRCTLRRVLCLCVCAAAPLLASPLTGHRAAGERRPPAGGQGAAEPLGAG